MKSNLDAKDPDFRKTLFLLGFPHWDASDRVNAAARWTSG